MADHVQDQILDALSALLIGAGTSAGASVFTERVDELPRNKTKAIEIEAQSEEIESPTNIGWPRTQMRAFALDIRCTVKQQGAYRKAAGNLAKEVEQAIAASQVAQTLGGIASLGVHLSRSVVAKDGSGDKALYSIVQSWTAGYQTRANAPDVPL